MSSRVQSELFIQEDTFYLSGENMMYKEESLSKKTAKLQTAFF